MLSNSAFWDLLEEAGAVEAEQYGISVEQLVIVKQYVLEETEGMHQPCPVHRPELCQQSCDASILLDFHQRLEHIAVQHFSDGCRCCRAGVQCVQFQ